MIEIVVLLVATVVSAAPLAAKATAVDGRIFHVHDGDPLTILDAENRQHKIRLDGIDAPELGQEFGQASRRALQQQALSRPAQATCHKADRYGRLVCRVQIECNDPGLQQLVSGMAWVVRRYEHELPRDTRTAYKRAEQDSRSARHGLWAEPERQPPWD